MTAGPGRSSPLPARGLHQASGFTGLHGAGGEPLVSGADASWAAEATGASQTVPPGGRRGSGTGAACRRAVEGRQVSNLCGEVSPQEIGRRASPAHQ